LKKLLTVGGLPVKKFFNSSGLLYKELQLKDKLPGMSEDQCLKLLATDGMLVKRPILVGYDSVCVGFRQDEWAKVIDCAKRDEHERAKRARDMERIKGQ
jgi:arsenate reductase